MKAIWDCFDVDHSGRINFESIKKAFTKWGREIPDKEVIEILKWHDLDDDNEISFEEFKVMMM